eukprot:TRINITY_DN19320_c0_g1_i1.p1 TRINITY_DN19320_c0_g1~~TRINITY_DN19320_c0_g1_i1.p1  ORF type:complete len:284 (+),score=80.25 TRINITY_DN19320_c0_g1_i1:70-852(+)
MFEARLTEAGLLKKILDSIKDLVTNARFDCTKAGITLQAMDTTHVSLVSLLLRAGGFDHYRCDTNLSLGINLPAMAKILKCAGNDDTVTLKADDEGDSVSVVFETRNQDKISDFELKLMEIDAERMVIPDQEYGAVIKLPANEFQKICRDLTTLGDNVMISGTKEGVKFSVNGDAGSGNVTLRPTSAADAKEGDSISINIKEPVQLTFGLKYLNWFSKATGLSTSVALSLSADIPLVVEYTIEDLGYVRYFLAPKVDDEE